MKLTPRMEWPPVEYRPALDAVKHDKAWLTGNLPQIKAQTTHREPQPLSHRAQYNGGLVGWGARATLGRPAPRHGSAHVDRHLPVAAELTETVGDLLFSNAVGVTVEDWPQELEESLRVMVDSDEFTADMVEAGQKCSALGWEFGRIVWNSAVSPHPWIEWVDADRAFADHQWGRLASVTFVDEYERDKHVYRLTQTHRVGEIEYQLWCGSDKDLGVTVPYTELEETAYLADEVEDGTRVFTGLDVLTAVMVPNRAKNPAWSDREQLRFYGKSDIQYAGGLWEDIDKGYTDLWYEVDSARARLLVSEDYLDTLAPGQGSVFDWFRDVYMIGQSASPDNPSTLERVQFNMRVDEYMRVVEQATVRAVGAVGLSAITVGMDTSANGNMTATEIRAKSSKTMNTWRARSRYWRAGLQQIIHAWACMDALMNGWAQPASLPKIAMAEPVQDTDLDRARAVKELRDSDSSSVYTRVKKLHPEWGEEEVEAEVARIRQDAGFDLPDPFSVAGDEYPAPDTTAAPSGALTALADAIRAGEDPTTAAEQLGLALRTTNE